MAAPTIPFVLGTSLFSVSSLMMCDSSRPLMRLHMLASVILVGCHGKYRTRRADSASDVASSSVRDRLDKMMRFILLGLLVVVGVGAMPASANGAEAQWQKTPEGDVILRPFANAPYPHKSREGGFKGGKTAYGPEHYTDSTVGIVVPAGYTPGDAVDYVVHFHGHLNHVANVLTKYKLARQLVDAKVNAILIVPQGPKDAADSGGGKLELDPGGFAKLIEEVTAYLEAEGKIKTTNVGRIALTAHSGGYKVTAAILHHGGMEKQITDVILLDASYGSLEWFAEWCKASSEHRLVSLFTDHLADENAAIMKLLDKAAVMYRQLEEGKLKDKELTARGPVFMHTKGPHDQVPVDYFGRLVGTSALK